MGAGAKLSVMHVGVQMISFECAALQEATQGVSDVLGRQSANEFAI